MKTEQDITDYIVKRQTELTELLMYTYFPISASTDKIQSILMGNISLSPAPPVSVPMHTYPDGSTRSKFPIHDEIFNEWNFKENSGAGGIVTWEYNSITNVWIRITQSPNNLPTHFFQPPDQSQQTYILPGTYAWNMSGPSSPMSTYGGYSGTLNGYDLESKKDTKKQPVCECGKEKHGFARHIYWCNVKENT